MTNRLKSRGQRQKPQALKVNLQIRLCLFAGASAKIFPAAVQNTPDAVATTTHREREVNPMVNKIADGVVVELAYTLTVDGAVFEQATAEEPLYYLHGQENIVPGLEAALAGKSVGDSLTVTLDPVDAYGDYDPENVIEGTLEEFDLPAGIKVGDEVEVEDMDGYLEIANIREISPDRVVLDFNSPLAGKQVTFAVEVLALRQGTEEELEMGEPVEVYAAFDEEFEDEE